MEVIILIEHCHFAFRFKFRWIIIFRHLITIGPVISRWTKSNQAKSILHILIPNISGHEIKDTMLKSLSSKFSLKGIQPDPKTQRKGEIRYWGTLEVRKVWYDQTNVLMTLAWNCQPMSPQKKTWRHLSSLFNILFGFTVIYCQELQSQM